MMSPFLGVGIAFLILGEVPDLVQGIAGGIIIVGMGITRWKRKDESAGDDVVEKSLAAA